MDKRILTAANHADVKRDTLDDHPGRGFARGALERAGDTLKPFGMEHQGSFAMHMYQVPGTNNFAFIAQCVGLDGIPEGQVDVALKECRRQLMALYGRNESTRNKI